MKRRKFLANSVIVGTAAIVAGPRCAASVWTSRPAVGPHAPRFSRAWFEKLIDSRFRIETPDGRAIDGRLVAVRDRGSSAERHQFSAVFRLPDKVEAGGLCWIEHQSEGRFQLHLDQACRIGSTNLCQAQFNLVA
jgi:hypothetical protein